MKKINNECAMIVGNDEIPGTFIYPCVAGIIKNTEGWCERYGNEPYFKKWFEENEVRLKVCVRQSRGNNSTKIKYYSPKIAVPLKGNAFESFDLRFSPMYPKEEKVKFINEVKELLHHCNMNIL